MLNYVAALRHRKSRFLSGFSLPTPFEECFMEPVFNKRAKLVAWLDNHSQVVFNLQCQPLAHVANRAVFNYGSEHLGYFDRGFFRDLSGNAVAFIRERSGGPITIAPA